MSGKELIFLRFFWDSFGKNVCLVCSRFWISVMLRFAMCILMVSSMFILFLFSHR
uniref:Uncharacterized protein n=1 Tax=Human betaherpesvirus 6 TaxID=10368 RepID=A0A5P9U3M0_9BETA|nr:hypothetical protein [Human betaherpesvirus 6]